MLFWVALWSCVSFGGKCVTALPVLVCFACFCLELCQKTSQNCHSSPKDYKISRLTPIMAMPAMTPAMAMWCFPYFSAVGRSSSSDMYIIMPATDAKIYGNTGPPPVNSTPNTAVTPRHSNAPMISLNPDRVAYSRALPLLFVA